MHAITKHSRRLVALALVLAVLPLVVPAAPARAEEETGRAAWLLGRGQLEDLALTGQRFEQGEIGGGGESLEVPGLEDGKGISGAWPVLMSLVLPGAGEVALGYKRGYFMAAADIYAWTRVAKYHGDGNDIKEAYIAFANEHYSDADLVRGYTSDQVSAGYRYGQGATYFPGVGAINSESELENLPLYVTKEDDFREYYENLGKWDQFIFGWDDYVRPDDAISIGVVYTPTGERDPDLQQPWVSKNREIYREMRGQSNDAYKDRDRWLYVNIGLRLVSVLQVAYLQGLLGGRGSELEVSGHAVEIRAIPMGFDAGSLSASVSF